MSVLLSWVAAPTLSSLAGASNHYLLWVEAVQEGHHSGQRPGLLTLIPAWAKAMPQTSPEKYRERLFQSLLKKSLMWLTLNPPNLLQAGRPLLLDLSQWLHSGQTLLPGYSIPEFQ
jgi:hypothetical protein